MFTKVKRAYARHARRKRAEIFRTLFPNAMSQSILDLGGSDGGHIASVVPGHGNVTVADINRKKLDAAEAVHGHKSRLLDESPRLPFRDAEFDIVFCSSVIEHVTGPKSKVAEITSNSEFREQAFAMQKGFAQEIRRIGRGYFVQTPFKHFPLESHTNTPGIVMLLPRSIQLEIWKRWPLCNHPPDFNLFTVDDMKQCFPESEIHLEHAFGLTKSIMAVKRI